MSPTLEQEIMLFSVIQKVVELDIYVILNFLLYI